MISGKAHAQAVNKDSIKSMRVHAGAGLWVSSGTQRSFINVTNFASSGGLKLKFNTDSVKTSFGFIPLNTSKKNQAPIAISPFSAVAIPSEIQELKLEAYDLEGDPIEYIIVDTPQLVNLSEMSNESGEFKITPKNSPLPNKVYNDTLAFKAREKVGDKLESKVVKFPFQFSVGDVFHKINKVSLLSATKEQLKLGLVFTDPVANESYDIRVNYIDLSNTQSSVSQGIINANVPFVKLGQSNGAYLYEFTINKSEHPYVFNTVNVILTMEIETESNSDSFAYFWVNSENTTGSPSPVFRSEDFNRVMSEGGVFFPFGSKKKTRERKRVSSKLYAADVNRSRSTTSSSANPSGLEVVSMGLEAQNTGVQSFVKEAKARIVTPPKKGKAGEPYVVIKSNALKVWEIPYEPNGNTDYTDTIEFEVTATNGEVKRVFSFIDVKAVNDPPQFKEIPDQQTNEETPITVDLNYLDPDPGAKLEVKIDSEEEEHFTWSLDEKKLLLNPVKDFNGLINVNVEVRESDTQEKYAKFQSFKLTVEPVNDQPIVNSIADQTIKEDTQLTKTLSATDADTQFPIFEYSAVIDQPQSAEVIILENQLNITPVANFNGILNVKLVADDKQGDTNSVSDTISFKLTVESVNDSPTQLSTIQDQKVVSGLTNTLDLKPFFNDVETPKEDLIYSIGQSDLLSSSISSGVLSISANNNQTGVASLKISVSDGQLTVSQDVKFEIVNTTGSSIDVKNLSDLALNEDFGTHQIDLKTTFTKTGASLTYESNSTQNVDITFNGDQMTITSKKDVFGTEKIRVFAKSGNDINYTEFNLTINSINDQPIFEQIPVTSMTEDEVYWFNVKVADADHEFKDLQLSATTNNQNLISNNNIEIVRLTDQFRIKLTPLANQFGDLILTLKASDGVQTTSQNINISVKSANDSPTRIKSTTIAATEDIAFSTDINQYFDDLDKDTLQYALESAPSWMNLSKSVISGTPTNADVGNGVLFITATDENGENIREEFNYTVVNTNDAPTLISALDNLYMSEDEFSSIIIDTLKFSDDDGDILSYEASFDGNSWLSFDKINKRFFGTPSNENVGDFDVNLRVKDPTGSTVETTFKLFVRNKNNAPTGVSLSKDEIPENSGSNVLIGDLIAKDIDAIDSHNFFLSSGEGDTDNSLFSIINNQLFVKESLNYEAKPTLSIRVTTIDEAGTLAANSLLINVQDIDETPKQFELSRSNFDENVSTSYKVATVTAIGNQEQNISFSLIAGDGSKDNGVFEIINNELFFKGTANYELQRAYAIRISANLNDQSLFSEPVELVLNDINEKPTTLGLSEDTVSESIGTTTSVAEITIVDEDFNEKHEVTLTDGEGDSDNKAFLLANKKLYFKESPDYETKSVYNIRVKVIDKGGLSIENNFLINLRDVNEPGTSIALSNAAIDENMSANSVVGELETNDPDENDQQTFEFVTGIGDSGNSLFDIIDQELVKKAPLNHEENDKYSVRVQSKDQAGNTIVSIFTINVNDVNDAPSAIAPSRTLQIFENVDMGTTLSTMKVIDEDENDSHTLSLVSGEGDTDNGLFKIEGDRVLTNGQIDYETKNSLSIRLQAQDQSGATVEQSFEVSVRNEQEGKLDLEQSLSFGAVNVGESNVLELLLTNSGEVDVEIRSIQLPQGFSLNNSIDEVVKGSTEALEVIFRPNENKNYQGQMLIVTNIGGYTIDLSGIGEQIITDIDDNPFEDTTFKLYPNPTSSLLNLDMKNIPLRVQLIEISDINGRVIFSTVRGNLDYLPIQVGGYENGVYMISMIHDNHVLTKKFIVKH